MVGRIGRSGRLDAAAGLSMDAIIETLGPWEGATIASVEDEEGWSRAGRDQRRLILTVLDAILTRCERRPDDPFIDTKLSLLDGADFPADDPIRGRGTIYGWIQGRALEALAGHGLWLQATALPPELRESFVGRIRALLPPAVEALEAIRAEHGGLSFMMARDGTSLGLDDQGRVAPRAVTDERPYNFSDLFYAKGLATAGAFLQRTDWRDAGVALFERVLADVVADRFASDQQPLDPANVAVRADPNRRGEGPRMIAVGACARLAQVTDDPGRWWDAGRALVDYLLAHHVAAEDAAPLRAGDMWEFIGPDGAPYPVGDHLLSDSGHACEFVGLALQLATVARVDLPESFARLGTVLRQNFANGWTGLGICKSYDLRTRRPIQRDMPWWSLPETLRAALSAAAILGEGREKYLEIARLCANAFSENFVRDDLHLMATQTIDENGDPIDAIPATPDADPGYHTGLSLIDALAVWPAT